MEEKQAFENRMLERLNAGRLVRSFLIAAVELLAEAVNLLVLQVFRKDDYAVKYAVEPLLLGDGPLGELPVRSNQFMAWALSAATSTNIANCCWRYAKSLTTIRVTIASPMMRSSARSASRTAWPPDRRNRNSMLTTPNCAPCSNSAIYKWCVQ